MRKSNHHSHLLYNIQHDLGHRHKHIAHLIEEDIKLTKLIKIYCKIFYKLKIKRNKCI